MGTPGSATSMCLSVILRTLLSFPPAQRVSDITHMITQIQSQTFYLHRPLKLL